MIAASWPAKQQILQWDSMLSKDSWRLKNLMMRNDLSTEEMTQAGRGWMEQEAQVKWENGED